jgi:polar amino acid transport system permease protein
MKLNFEGLAHYAPLFWVGFKGTVALTVGALILAVLFSIPLVAFRMSKVGVLRLVARAYISVFRAVPLIVSILFVYFGVVQIIGHGISNYSAGIIALALCEAAFLSELVRGGIEGVDIGQKEAAISLGISKPRVMFGILLPQAFRSILPGLVNELIGTLKATALVYSIGYVELLRATNIVITNTYRAFEPYLIVASIYYVMVMSLTLLSNRLEVRIKRSYRS